MLCFYFSSEERKWLKCLHNFFRDIQVGDIILLHKNQRIPADVILLRTSEPSGGCFIRTDQLDGETDWKLRLAIPALQHLQKDKVKPVNLWTKEEQKF